MILVVGATGLLGGRITCLLLYSGREVRILVRRNSPSEALSKQSLATTAQSLIQAGAQPVYGDLTDPVSLDAACQGVDTVITTATAALRGGKDTLDAVDLKGTLNLIAAAKKAGVRHFIYTSALARNINIPGLPQFKALCENAVKDSGMEYTILRPSCLEETWVGQVVGVPARVRQPVTLMGKGDHKQNFVWDGDVAAYAVASIDDPRAKNREIDIGGPASYTWTEVVSAAEKYLECSLPVQFVPLGSPLPLLHPIFGILMTGAEMSESYVDMSRTAAEFGIAVTPLEVGMQKIFRSAA